MMKLIGLTGGVGMGKSTSTQWLERRGWLVVDTDVLAREVVAPGEPALAEILEEFGQDMADAHGRLRREVMARVVFGDEAKRRQLEAIVHPRIRERWQSQVTIWAEQEQPAAVVVIPLLFETQAEEAFDEVVCVACSTSSQKARLAARGWDDAQIHQRRAAQWPIERKMLRSDFVIWTEAGLDLHEAQWERVAETMGLSGNR